MDEKLTIDPWGSSQSTDYSRIIDQFGLSSLDGLAIENPQDCIEEESYLLTENSI